MVFDGGVWLLQTLRQKQRQLRASSGMLEFLVTLPVRISLASPTSPLSGVSVQLAEIARCGGLAQLSRRKGTIFYEDGRQKHCCKD
jgi:hypothetical protein